MLVSLNQGHRNHVLFAYVVYPHGRQFRSDISRRENSMGNRRSSLNWTDESDSLSSSYPRIKRCV